LCQGEPKLPGLWEIPMYAIFDQRGDSGIHLMDPWLDDPNPLNSLAWMQDTFLTHYNGNRQPFGIYTHPIHVATGYPGVVDPISTINMINTFIDWLQTHPNVWLINNQQLLAWMQHPVPISQMGSFAPVACSVPQVDANICNGIEANEQGLLENCPFIDFPWTTCYGCPVEQPTPENPVPVQNTSLGLRYRLPANCSTAFFDPIANKCLCESSSCAFTDQTRPIGNYSEGGSGQIPTGSSSASSSEPTGYTPFNTSGGNKLGSGMVGGLVIMGLMAVLV